jgi:hypothetical protein
LGWGTGESRPVLVVSRWSLASARTRVSAPHKIRSWRTRVSAPPATTKSEPGGQECPPRTTQNQKLADRSVRTTATRSQKLADRSVRTTATRSQKLADRSVRPTATTKSEPGGQECPPHTDARTFFTSDAARNLCGIQAGDDEYLDHDGTRSHFDRAGGMCRTSCMSRRRMCGGRGPGRSYCGGWGCGGGVRAAG